MPGQLRMIDCELCAPVVGAPASSLRLIANRIVTSREEMLLVADHAPMTLGHLLLIPRDHHTGMASFVAARPGAAAVIRELTQMYCHGFGACTVIEHGSGGTTSRTGPCIDHAHWHLFPFRNELRPIVDGDYGASLKRLDSLTQLSRTYAKQDYLLYWDHEGARAALLDAPAHLPQYARSVWRATPTRPRDPMTGTGHYARTTCCSAGLWTLPDDFSPTTTTRRDSSNRKARQGK